MRSQIIILLFLITQFSFSNNRVDSLKNIINTSQDTVKIDALINLAEHYNLNSEFPLAIVYLKKAIYESENHKKRLTYAYLKISNSYYSIGDYPTSLQYALTNLKNQTKNRTSFYIFDLYNNTGVSYTALKEYNKALTYLNKALNISIDSLDKVIVLHNIGEVYSKLGEYEIALEKFLQSESIIKKLGREQAILYINIGDTYLKLNKYDKANEYFEKALKSSLNEKSEYYKAMSLKYKADLLLKQQKYVQSLIEFNKAVNISKKIDANEILKVSYMGLVELYSLTLNSDSILKYSQLVYAIKDSIFSKQKADKTAEFQVAYEFQQKEQEIENLKTQKQLADKKQKIYLSIFTLLLFSVIIIFLIIYNRKSKSFAEKLSIKQSKEIIKYEKVIDNSTSEQKIDLPKDPNSDLSEEYKSELEIRISKMIRKDKLYLKNDFSLDELSKMLETNRRYVSIVINERLGQNFNSVINEFRIKEGMKLMSDPVYSKYTIDTISKEVGFNSISAFNRAFKKISGVTPSAFIKSIKN